MLRRYDIATTMSLTAIKRSMQMKIIFSLLLSLGMVGASICSAADPGASADKLGVANSQDAKKADSRAQDAKKVDSNSQEVKKGDSEPAKAPGASSTESGSGNPTPAAPAKSDSATGSSGTVAEDNVPGATNTQ
jgi:hypothetical protein